MRTNEDWQDKYGDLFRKPRILYRDDDGTAVFEDEPEEIIEENENNNDTEED